MYRLEDFVQILLAYFEYKHPLATTVARYAILIKSPKYI